MSARWYVNRNGVVEGPFDESAIVARLSAGDLRDASVGREGGAEWAPIATHPPFAAAMGAVSAPSAPVAAAPSPTPQGRLDAFIHAQVEPRLRPGESLRGVGAVRRYPKYNALKNPVGNPQHFLAAATRGGCASRSSRGGLPIALMLVVAVITMGVAANYWRMARAADARAETSTAPASSAFGADADRRSARESRRRMQPFAGCGCVAFVLAGAASAPGCGCASDSARTAPPWDEAPARACAAREPRRVHPGAPRT